MSIITRFAPSPTGLFHVGSGRTALFSYLYAKQNNGIFLLRIEDTDEARNKPEWTEMIFDSLKWLGIDYTQSYIQSERKEVYKKYLEKLISEGKAYISKEEVKEEGQRAEVIRFKNPNKKVKFTDLIRGEIEFDTTELGDFVIAKSLSEPVFHFTNVVDDMDSGVTHAIRGEDHISNTPRHILLFEALGGIPPTYAHLPLILSDKKEKLSKRKHGEMVSIEYYQRNGYLPEALINFLALIGWNPGTEQEVMSLNDLIEKFDIHKVQKAGAVFNPEKLNWFNREYVMKLTSEDFDQKSRLFIPEWLLRNDDLYAKVNSLIREKISFFGEIPKMFDIGGELNFVKEIRDYNADLLLWKKSPSREESKEHLTKVRESLSGLVEKDFTAEGVKDAIWTYAEEKGRGNVLWPLRVSLTGQEKSPDPFMSAYILGKEESLRRIDMAISKLA